MSREGTVHDFLDLTLTVDRYRAVTGERRVGFTLWGARTTGPDRVLFHGSGPDLGQTRDAIKAGVAMALGVPEDLVTAQECIDGEWQEEI